MTFSIGKWGNDIFSAEKWGIGICSGSSNNTTPEYRDLGIWTVDVLFMSFHVYTNTFFGKFLLTEILTFNSEPSLGSLSYINPHGNFLKFLFDTSAGSFSKGGERLWQSTARSRA